MKALKFDLIVPFWCSFGDFASLNIKLSYPVPPLPTLFGMILNAMGKPALHCIQNKDQVKQLKSEYINLFNDLKFSILIKNQGELVEDFTNIHKGSRISKSRHENELKKVLEEHKNKFGNDFNVLCKHDFYLYLINEKKDNNKFNKLLDFIDENDYGFVFEIIYKFWQDKTDGVEGYNLNVYFMSTQINRQKIINPTFTIYICSHNDSEFSLENIYNMLNNPSRPLYLGESDDVVDITNIEIVELTKSKSSKISSIIPNICSNSDLFKLPINLKYNLNESITHYIVCSIPKGDINTEIDCYTFNGENFVFL